MRIKFKNKNIIMAFVILGVILSSSLSVTLAYFVDNTEKITNKFTVKSVRSEISEDLGAVAGGPESEVAKKAYVENKGEVNCLVRVKVHISPSNMMEFISLDYNLEDWRKGSDDFYYYKNYVEPGKRTSPLFTHVTWKGNEDYSDFEEFDIILYQEAIQTRVVDSSGDSISAIEEGKYSDDNAIKLWEIYDQKAGEE